MFLHLRRRMDVFRKNKHFLLSARQTLYNSGSLALSDKYQFDVSVFRASMWGRKDDYRYRIPLKPKRVKSWVPSYRMLQSEIYQKHNKNRAWNPRFVCWQCPTSKRFQTICAFVGSVKPRILWKHTYKRSPKCAENAWSVNWIYEISLSSLVSKHKKQRFWDVLMISLSLILRHTFQKKHYLFRVR